MDKLSEYVPIIIILVSLIFTVIGKKKKPGSIAHKTVSPWQTEEEVHVDSSFPLSFTETYQKNVVEKKEKQILRKPESKPKNKDTGLPTTPLISEPETEENSPFSFEEDDDVVRAIIYSEIINRKEY